MVNLRCSYFVYNGIADELAEELEKQEDSKGEAEMSIDSVSRFILSDKPRIKHTDILWDNDFYSKP